MADEEGATPGRRKVRIGTRGSQLARWQSNWVADRLRSLHPGLEIELIEIKTQGDRDRNSPLAAIGGTGLFTKEIQRALLEGVVEVAVHSLKDLPTKSPEGLTLGAIPEREDVADALIAPQFESWSSLAPTAKIGTGSLRRRAMLLHARPGLEVVNLRGNVETRLNQALNGSLDAVVLASAGLRRLGLDRHITYRLEPPEFLPAAGQGALGIECRSDDRETLDLLSALNHAPTRAAVLAERQTLAELEGGCLIPLGAFGLALPDGRMTLDAAVYEVDGKQKISARAEGMASEPHQLGRAVAEKLLNQGAEELLARIRKH